MKCPCCGAAELIHDTRDMPFIYKGETTTIPAVTGDFFTAHSTPRQTSHSLQPKKSSRGVFFSQLKAS